MPDRSQIIKHELAQSDLFFEWDDLLLDLIVSICEERTYNLGDVIFDETSESDELYIIQSGEVEIQVYPGTIGTSNTSELKTETIATLRKGQNFGEVALLDYGRRTASAVCSEGSTQLIVISRDRLITMCDNVPRLGYHLMRNIATDLAMKIRNTDLNIREQLTWNPNPHR